MKVVVTGTPRSGNTWTSRLITALFGLEHRSEQSPSAVDWPATPERFLLQTHCHRTAEALALLGRERLRMVTIARHPLSVLISILHYARHEPRTAEWLGGEAGEESAILEATPRSPAFLEYAVGPRARALLSVTPQWWAAPDCLRVRYEDLCRDPAAELRRLVSDLGEPPARSIEEVLARHTMENYRAGARNQHFWQGRPDLWRELLTADEARAIAHAHRDVFLALGYSPEIDDGLPGGEQADRNWLRLEVEEMKGLLSRARAELHEAREGWRQARGEAESWRDRLDGCGDRSIEVARRLSGLARRHPGIAAALRRAAGGARKIGRSGLARCGPGR